MAPVISLMDALVVSLMVALVISLSLALILYYILSMVQDQVYVAENQFNYLDFLGYFGQTNLLIPVSH